MTERPLCPDPETLGVFAEGKASPADVAAIREHLATCNDCLGEVGEVTQFERESGIVVPMRPAARTAPRRGWFAAAAVLILAIGGLWAKGYDFYMIYMAGRSLVLQPRSPRHALKLLVDPTQRLQDALPADSRVIEPRLSGFPYRDYHAMRGPGEETDLGLQSAALHIMLNTRSKAWAAQRHADALAKLLMWRDKEDGSKNVQEAVAELTELAKERPKDAQVQSDLAAALLWAADRRQAKYEDALQAANRAVQLRPSLPEAQFNRALILERIDPSKAQAAWEQYLRTEPNNDWVIHVRGRYIEPGQ